MITSSDAYIISTNNSDVPTYLWFVNDRMLYYSEADTIYLNENSSSMFYKSQFKPQFKSIDISGMDSSKVTNMRAMFSGQSYLTTLELGDFKTDNVTNMYDAFYGLNNLTSLDVSSWNTSKVTNMEGTFYYCRTLEELDVSNWDTSNVTTMYQLFYSMDNLKSLDLSKWDVSNVTNMEGMFYLDKKLTSLDLSSFDTEKLQKTTNMFARDPNLETIYVSEKWNMSGVTSSYSMFGNSTSIVGQEGTTYDSSHTDKEYARIDEGESNPGYLTYKAYTGKYKVTLPDKVIKVPAGSTYEIPENTYDKASANGATVTFVYNNGHENTTSNVMTQYAKNGFTIGETHYDESDTIVVNSDITLVPDYIETSIAATFPEDPTYIGYTFDGWYTQNDGGTRVTSYNGSDDIILYARWVVPAPTPGPYTLPVNNILIPDETYTVTFKYNNGTSDTTSSFTISYTPNGWIYDGIHYNDGDIINYEEGKILIPDFIETSTSVLFPLNPSKINYTFVGWFDNANGGNKIISYNEKQDITLYAHWKSIYDLLDGIICQRATSIHTKNGITYGQIGTANELNVGDAFDCDVNGDGVYDDDIERFYYVSRRYNVDTVSSFNDNYAVLLYSYNTYYGEPTTRTNYAPYASSGKNESGPISSLSHIPSTTQWPNVRLKDNYRQLRQRDGTMEIDSNTNYPRFYYNGRSARLLTHQEVVNAVGTLSNTGNYPFFTENGAYWNLETPQRTSGNVYTITETGSGGYSTNQNLNVRPAIEIPISNMNLTTEPIPTLHTVTLPDYIDEVEHGKSYVIPNNKYDKLNDNVASVTFDYQDGRENLVKYVEKEYLNNGFKINNVHYDSNSTYVVNSDITLVPDYSETVIGIIFPDEPTRPGFTFDGWYTDSENGTLVTEYNNTSDITLYAHWSKTAESNYVLPVNNGTKNDSILSTVTFKFNNGSPDVTRNVVVKYTPNGWLVDGVHYNNGEEVATTSETVIFPDYVENNVGVIFPSNPVKVNARFTGWYDAPVGGNKYTSYNGENDLILYAQYGTQEGY